MRAQRRLVSPWLEEEQPHRVLAVDMHVMRDAARLVAGALDMLQARAEHVIESVLARKNTARYENHAFPRCASGPRPTGTGRRRGGLELSVSVSGAASQRIPPTARRGCPPRTISSGPSWRR